MFPPPPFPLCINLRESTASASRGATLGARIDRDISLIMPPSFMCPLRTQTAQSDGTNRRASTLAFLAALRLVFRLRMSRNLNCTYGAISLAPRANFTHAMRAFHLRLRRNITAQFCKMLQKCAIKKARSRVPFFRCSSIICFLRRFLPLHR